MTKLSFSHNLGLKVVALVMGLAVFLYVNSLELAKETNTRQVPLIVTGLGTDVEVVSIPDSINVTLKAPFDVMEKLNLNNLNLRAYVNLDNAEPGEGNYVVRLNRPVDIKDLEYDWDRTVPVKLEAIIEEPHVVNVEWPDGFDEGNSSINVDKVTLRGPESEMKKVSSIRVQLTPKQVLSGGTFSLPVEIVDGESKLLSRIEARPRNVTVTLLNGGAQPRRDLLISPKFTGQPKAGYTVQSIKVEPSSVVVTGDRNAIVDLSMLETLPIRLDGQKSTFEVKTRVVLPPGVRLIGENDIVVRIKMSKS